MAEMYLLIGQTLPPDIPHETVTLKVRLFVSDCWVGMSRAQMMARTNDGTFVCRCEVLRDVRPAPRGMFDPFAGDGIVHCRLLAQLRRKCAEAWRKAAEAPRRVPAASARSPSGKPVLILRRLSHSLWADSRLPPVEALAILHALIRPEVLI